MFLLNFLGEAVLTSIHLINKFLLPHTFGLSPFEKLYGYAHDYSSLKIFGCTCFFFHPQVECNKLSTHSIICVFLGYGESQKGYRCFDSISHKLYISRNVYFLKHILFFSILVESHNVSKSELVHVDPFLDDINSFLTYTNALVLDHYAPSPSTTTPTPSKVVDPLFPHSSQHFCKFTRLPNFVYSSY